MNGSIFFAPSCGLKAHLAVVGKSCIVLSSWLFGYIGLKNLPLTITAPINATRPVMTLVGAMLIFGERLNLYQWIGVILAIFSLFLLSRSGKKEGINFSHNRYIWSILLAAILGACSGLYDRYLMRQLNPMFVQSWYMLYQAVIMIVIVAIIYFYFKQKIVFHWSFAIPLISIFITCADIAYLYSLSCTDAMISIVSMVRRSSVIVSFVFGALLFREHNLKTKAIDLLFILIGMIFLYVGTK